MPISFIAINICYESNSNKNLQDVGDNCIPYNNVINSGTSFDVKHKLFSEKPLTLILVWWNSRLK